MSKPLKAICRLNIIPIKISIAFFTDLEKTILKFKQNQNHIAKVIRTNINQAWEITKRNYKAIITKTTWIWHKNGHADQWNTGPEINSYTNSQLILQKCSGYAFRTGWVLQQTVLAKLVDTDLCVYIIFVYIYIYILHTHILCICM